MHCGWICALAKKELYDALLVECLLVVLAMDAMVLMMFLATEAILVLALIAYPISIMFCEAEDFHLAMDNAQSAAECVGYPTGRPTWQLNAKMAAGVTY